MSEQQQASSTGTGTGTGTGSGTGPFNYTLAQYQDLIDNNPLLPKPRPRERVRVRLGPRHKRRLGPRSSLG